MTELGVLRRGEALILRSRFDDDQHLLQPLHLARQQVAGGEVMVMFANATLPRVSLVPADAADERLWSKPWLALRATPIHDAADDICPIMLSDTGRYVGANHGWFDEAAGRDVHPATHSHESAVTLDGSEVPDGVSRGAELVVTESYVIAARDGNGDFGTVQNVYRFGSHGTRVEQTFTTSVPAEVNLGVTQAAALRVPRGGTLRQAMPGLGGWADPVDLATVAEQLNVTSEPPADVAAQWAYDRKGRRLYGIELDVVSGRNVPPGGRSWSLPVSTKKNYPHVTWGTKLAAGEAVSGAVKRRYLAP